MKKKIVLVGIVAAALAASQIILGAQKQRDVELQLKAAMNTELVDGNLKSAIEQYKKVAKSGIRPLAAQALLHMAECYQKLGDADARKTYEQVLRDYSDQPEVVSVARARLGAPASGAGIAYRRIWGTAPESGWSLSSISPDGRLVAYIDWVTGHFGVHEFATGRDRRLTQSGFPNWVEDASISRDSRSVAYNLFNDLTNRYELHVTSVEGTSDSRLLFKADDVDWIMPYDWSPDGNWIAVQLSRSNRAAQMGLVSANDGSLRVLRSADWLGASRLFFSPDGKYVGYDLPVLENPQQRDVFVLAVAGDRQTPAATGPTDERMVGWSLDGKHLLFSSNRSGATGLWAVAVAEGQPRGEPELVKSDIGSSLGITASGSLYSVVTAGDRDVRIASVDLSTGKLLTGPVKPIPSFVGTNSDPAWSPDGKKLAYRSDRGRLGSAFINSDVLGILSLETGRAHELNPKLGYFQNIRWLPDGSLVVNGRDLNGNRRNYRVDPETGEISPFAGNGQGPSGKTYFRKDLGADGGAVMERTVATGNERELFRRKGLDNRFFLSPDRRFIAATTTRPDDGTSGKPWTVTVLLANVEGGELREIKVQQPSTRIRPVITWMADSRALALSSMLGEESKQVELQLVPIDGSRPRKIDVGATDFGNDLVFSPDGSRVAYTSGKSSSEVWVLENFLGGLKAGK
jgi:Tol biopolymer transport system component